LIFAAKKAAFWGERARTRALTPKCGGLSWESPIWLALRRNPNWQIYVVHVKLKSQKEIRMNQNPGCLSGLLKLFLIDTIAQFMQRKFGVGRGGCCGCGCGVVIFIIATTLICSTLLGTNWLNFGF
jgi:hypothetical protein